uniref:Methyltransferase type 11 domain-containing protein n=1 Tax=Kwoniella dejecticola CBS 10117 TaxID=1296121 RepID=A0A1A6A031_9TREE|nr:uncharacterized protein I303_05691 [Kwoniella dejecticola CBS 10117]OBR83413.1 hypothetical protein I303_05691 [Kwoniella dejecticola CBS 10117]
MSTSTSKFNQAQWLSATPLEMYEGTYNITSPAAEQLSLQSGLPSIAKGGPNLGANDGIEVLDLGSGLGQVTQELIKLRSQGQVEPTRGIRITAGDIDETFLDNLRSKQKVEKGWDIVNVEKLDANGIDRPNDTFDCIYTNFLYFLLKDSVTALEESIRVLKPRGTLSFSTWAYAGPLHLLQHAIALLPSYPLTPSPPPEGPWTQPEYIRKILIEHNMKEIKVTPFEFQQYADSPKEMARKMWPVVKIITSQWGERQGELGWTMFEKIEELLRRDQGDGRVKIISVALIVTAKKP